MSDGLSYLDASALVKLVLPEPESSAILSSLEESSHQHVTSEISTVEVIRAARRASKDQRVHRRAREVLSAVHLLKLNSDVLDRAASLDPPKLRALEAIHLSAALSLGEALRAMYVYDSALARAARAAGVRILSPR
jgi:uncharacterized protein